MGELRACCEKLGLTNVRTYINSGNVIFEAAKKDTAKLSASLESAIENGLSVKTKVMVRTQARLLDLLKNNPFAEHKKDIQELFIVFLAAELSNEKRDLLLAQNTDNESFQIDGDDVFCLMNKGFQNSLLGKRFIDDKLKVPATARNIRTIEKIAAMLENR